jgi:hypothetical protein
MQRLIEIRAYQLKPGAAAAFHALFVERAVPMLEAAGMEVVSYGPSTHEPDTYYLIRGYRDLDELRAQQDGFYGSAAWRDGPREAILALIDTFLNTVLWASPDTVANLRRLNTPG